MRYEQTVKGFVYAIIDDEIQLPDDRTSISYTRVVLWLTVVHSERRGQNRH